MWPDFIIPEEFDIFPEKTNLAAELLDSNLEKGRGDIVAVYFQDQRVTFSELAERVNRLGNSLLELGVQSMDRVGIRFVNSPDAIVANFAIQKIGAIPLPMSPLWSWHEIEFSSNNAETVAIIVSAPLVGEVMKCVDKMQFNKHVIVSGRGPDAVVPGTLAMSDLIQKEGSSLT